MAIHLNKRHAHTYNAWSAYDAHHNPYFTHFVSFARVSFVIHDTFASTASMPLSLAHSHTPPLYLLKHAFDFTVFTLPCALPFTRNKVHWTMLLKAWQKKPEVPLSSLQGTRTQTLSYRNHPQEAQILILMRISVSCRRTPTNFQNVLGGAFGGSSLQLLCGNKKDNATQQIPKISSFKN